jgi:nucleotide-binding universal stress UspA family protein
MLLRHILIPTDESDAARSALRVALEIAQRTGARVTVLTVVPGRAAPAVGGGAADAAVSGIARWAGRERRAAGAIDVVFAAAHGIPAVEICRFADEQGVDLIVVGHKRRSQQTRLLTGDTADGIIRRSAVPCLLVPPDAGLPRHLMAALDGSRRGLVVLHAARDFASAIGGRVSAVSIEPVRHDDPADEVEWLPSSRALALQETVAGLAQCSTGDCGCAVLLRRGPVVETVLDAAAQVGAEAVALGYHRGGPAGVIEAGSYARRLVHQADGCVLTVPL